MLRTRMQWHQERQRLLAENVANADTPNFRPRDLAPLKFGDPTQVRGKLGRQRRAGDAPRPATSPARGRRHRRSAASQAGGYEVRPTGNAVNLEDEMMKVAANQMDYQAATALYTRSLGLIKTALGKTAEEKAPWTSSNHGDRRLRPARAGRPHAHHLGEHRQRRIRPRRARRRSVPAQDPDLQIEIDRALDAQLVELGKVQTDPSDFRVKYEPGHPAADANGNVKYPNVNSLVEMTDMREAQRSYEANINVISATRRMIQRTIDILKALIPKETDRMATPMHRRQRLRQRSRKLDRSVRAALRQAPARGEPSGPSFGAHAQGGDRLGHRDRPQVRRADAARWPPAKANMVDVVTAVAETEVAIERVVSVRDKVIAAYEEIMKMPI